MMFCSLGFLVHLHAGVSAWTATSLLCLKRWIHCNWLNTSSGLHRKNVLCACKDFYTDNWDTGLHITTSHVSALLLFKLHTGFISLHLNIHTSCEHGPVDGDFSQTRNIHQNRWNTSVVCFYGICCSKHLFGVAFVLSHRSKNCCGQ